MHSVMMTGKLRVSSDCKASDNQHSGCVLEKKSILESETLSVVVMCNHDKNRKLLCFC